jgi:hypothetical protein
VAFDVLATSTSSGPSDALHLGLLAIVLAGLVSQLGFFVFCVGILPASFWSMCVMGYVVGELAKLDQGRPGGREAES